MKRSISITCILLIALAVTACVPVPISEVPIAIVEKPTPAALEEAMAPAEPPTDISCENSYQGESLTIYQQAALTGPLATVTGTGFVSAAQDALDQINADGGVCGVM